MATRRRSKYGDGIIDYIRAVRSLTPQTDASVEGPQVFLTPATIDCSHAQTDHTASHRRS